MNRFGVSSRPPAVAALLALAFLVLSSCGSSVGDLAGGGTGGTGISTGAITGFGSVVMNGAHFPIDNEVAPGFKTKKIVKGKDRSDASDRDLFSVGMVVTIRHSPNDNNAMEIDYEPNLVGPIGAKVADGADPPTIMVLGLPVIVDNADLNPGNVVEVSGFVDNVGRIRATFVSVEHPSPIPGEEFEVKGFISDSDPSDNTFHLGPLPDGSGITVTVSYTTEAIQGLPPGGPVSGMYVQVKTTDTQPVNGMITAIQITISVARTDFPENATVDLDGLVTKLGSSSGDILSFDLEGKPVQADDSTIFAGGAEADIQPNVRIQVLGMEIDGTLSAAQIVFRR